MLMQDFLPHRAHTGRVRSLWWSPDDTTLLTCGAEGSVYQWRVAGLSCVREFALQVGAAQSSVAIKDQRPKITFEGCQWTRRKLASKCDMDL